MIVVPWSSTTDNIDHPNEVSDDLKSALRLIWMSKTNGPIVSPSQVFQAIGAHLVSTRFSRSNHNVFSPIMLAISNARVTEVPSRWDPIPIDRSLTRMLKEDHCQKRLIILVGKVKKVVHVRTNLLLVHLPRDLANLVNEYIDLSHYFLRWRGASAPLAPPPSAGVKRGCNSLVE